MGNGGHFLLRPHEKTVDKPLQLPLLCTLCVWLEQLCWQCTWWGELSSLLLVNFQGKICTKHTSLFGNKLSCIHSCMYKPVEYNTNSCYSFGLVHCCFSAPAVPNLHIVLKGLGGLHCIQFVYLAPHAWSLLLRSAVLCCSPCDKKQRQ